MTKEKTSFEKGECYDDIKSMLSQFNKQFCNNCRYCTIPWEGLSGRSGGFNSCSNKEPGKMIFKSYIKNLHFQCTCFDNGKNKMTWEEEND